MNVVQANAESCIGARIGWRKGAITGILGAATLGVAAAIEGAGAVGGTRDCASFEADQYPGRPPAENDRHRVPAPSS